MQPKRTRYNVYIEKVGVKAAPPTSPIDHLFWSRQVWATSRTDAVQKCRQAIVAEVIPAMDNGKSLLAVYVGKAHNPTCAANRMEPLTVDLTGRILEGAAKRAALVALVNKNA